MVMPHKRWVRWHEGRRVPLMVADGVVAIWARDLPDRNERRRPGASAFSVGFGLETFLGLPIT
jgi:hypothetical protein